MAVRVEREVMQVTINGDEDDDAELEYHVSSSRYILIDGALVALATLRRLIAPTANGRAWRVTHDARSNRDVHLVAHDVECCGNAKASDDAGQISQWNATISAAQADKTCVVNGRTYGRVPYGYEGHLLNAEATSCDECRVNAGELHVHGCAVEDCPRCEGPLISCGCEHGEGAPPA